MIQLGKVLRGWRMHNELSQRAVARMLKLSPATYMRLEHGKHSPDGRTISTLIRWLLDESSGKGAR